MNPPHAKVMLPGIVPSPHEALQSPSKQPVNALNAVSPAGFASMQPCTHASSEQAWAQLKIALQSVLAAQAPPSEQHELWRHWLQAESDEENPQLPPFPLVPTVPWVEQATTMHAAAKAAPMFGNRAIPDLLFNRGGELDCKALRAFAARYGERSAACEETAVGEPIDEP